MTPSHVNVKIKIRNGYTIVDSLLKIPSLIERLLALSSKQCNCTLILSAQFQALQMGGVEYHQ